MLLQGGVPQGAIILLGFNCLWFSEGFLVQYYMVCIYIYLEMTSLAVGHFHWYKIFTESDSA